MTIYTPFTYVLTHVPTGKRYYGVRYALKCNPRDLWTTYFTSSLYVRQLIEEYGKDSFLFEVRKIFDNKIEALVWEHKVLRRLKVRKSDKWINKTDHVTYRRSPNSKRKPHSEASKRKMSLVAMGKRGTRLGFKNSEITKLRQGAAKAKTYYVTCPSGNTSLITNLSLYCRNNKLIRANLLKVADGKRNHHRGFRCQHSG